MRTARLARWIGTLLAALFLSWPAAPQEASHYTRFRDAKWYALQLQSLRGELAKIDTDVRTLVEARKSGKGITDAVALEQLSRNNRIVSRLFLQRVNLPQQHSASLINQNKVVRNLSFSMF
jgi:hypothetical protein